VRPVITNIRDRDIDDRGHKLYTPEGMEGVAGCKNCGGFEGTLPSWCPGKKMSASQQDEVYAGLLDFNKGPMDREPHWWVKS